MRSSSEDLIGDPTVANDRLASSTFRIARAPSLGRKPTEHAALNNGQRYTRNRQGQLAFGAEQRSLRPPDELLGQLRLIMMVLSNGRVVSKYDRIVRRTRGSPRRHRVDRLEKNPDTVRVSMFTWPT